MLTVCVKSINVSKTLLKLYRKCVYSPDLIIPICKWVIIVPWLFTSYPHNSCKVLGQVCLGECCATYCVVGIYSFESCTRNNVSIPWSFSIWNLIHFWKRNECKWNEMKVKWKHVMIRAWVMHVVQWKACSVGIPDSNSTLNMAHWLKLICCYRPLSTPFTSSITGKGPSGGPSLTNYYLGNRPSSVQQWYWHDSDIVVCIVLIRYLTTQKSLSAKTLHPTPVLRSEIDTAGNEKTVNIKHKLRSLNVFL